MKKSSLLVLCWVLLVAAPAAAAPQDVANEVSKELMSPYCEGVTLHDCASGAAIKLRARIVAWAEAGWSKERIIDHLTSDDQWGDIIRATPPSEGTGLVAWLLPGLAALAGLGAAAFVVRTWSRRRSPAPAIEPVTAAERSRLDQELAQLRSET